MSPETVILKEHEIEQVHRLVTYSPFKMMYCYRWPFMEIMESSHVNMGRDSGKVTIVYNESYNVYSESTMPKMPR